MKNTRSCNYFYDPNTANYLIEYRGNFEEQMSNVDYACGARITASIGVISVAPENLSRLLREVPSIIFQDFRTMYVLQEISPSAADNISSIKINPYLNLTGNGVLVGIVDTGIDYLNQEFIREDGISRIAGIWDQSIEDKSPENSSIEKPYMGTLYTNEQINQAINASKNNQDPYAIVPSRDERGHGTKVAGIVGARGYTGEFEGVAHDCEFVIVKLFESTNFKKRLEANGIMDVPTYNASELVAGIEYLKRVAISLLKPIVIYIGIGSTEGAHDGFNLIERYVASIADNRGICMVAGGGNEGASQGHVTGNLKNVGDVQAIELRIPREMKSFSFFIWIQKPNRASINIISPTGEESKVIESKLDKRQSFKFVFVRTNMTVRYYTPEYFTGHEVINISFEDIKPGIWTFQLIGVYVINGRFDAWLPPKDTLPENTVFLKSDPYTTITLPCMAPNTVTVAYYGIDKALIAASGKGFNANYRINPDIATIGMNVITTQPAGGVTTMSGCSAATAIVAGTCALLLQWGIVNGNDLTMYSRKIRSYLMYGAGRNQMYKYPNRELGYGELDILGTFDALSKTYRGKLQEQGFAAEKIIDNSAGYEEYSIKKLYIRIPIKSYRWGLDEKRYGKARGSFLQHKL
ncbi:S8 family peptidase [Clostridium cellulovorans]|uniref:Peptidase S8 and S53 subtilisin kexin sedolisin n=1 Tax=Clostridium cellulovorans (strain ATCC 35296 / DSM 3052 / OCM 3 / 743B) TaxID=573061 RepID=D9SWT2_CLOC7|nr:S8 family peptidase [Clostridium cellulovorans]ADL51293.1 peptidase S8 and S53 subtilisin kexin sedolisin [Clostridium cellulovorans 743B]